MEIILKFKVKEKDYVLDYDEGKLLYEELRKLYEKPSNFTPWLPEPIKFDEGRLLNAKTL